MLEKYPQLTNVGGGGGSYLLMYQRGGGADSRFHVINPPHTVSRLKDLCRQSKIYVRTLQQSMQLASCDKESESTSDESSAHVLTQGKEKCIMLYSAGATQDYLQFSICIFSL